MSFFNGNPISITGPMASGWKSLQTLNTGQWGIRVTKVSWDDPAVPGDAFIIKDPKDTTGMVLLQGTCDTAHHGLVFDFGVTGVAWRDFQVVTLSSGTLQIWYRA